MSASASNGRDERPRTREEVAREVDRINRVLMNAIFEMSPSADPECAALALLAAGTNVAIGSNMSVSAIHSAVDATYHAPRADVAVLREGR